MKRITRRTRRISMFVKGFNRQGERILNASRRIPAAFIRLIEASSAVHFKVKIVYGRAKTISKHIEDIVNEIDGDKKTVLVGIRIMTSASELDAIEKYWSFI